jgi:hypothetical protein
MALRENQDVLIATIFHDYENYAQAILDTLNTYREPGTRPYESLNEVSLNRIRYWVRIKLNEVSQGSDWHTTYTYIDTALEALGAVPHAERWGIIQFGKITSRGIFDVRDTSE